LFYFHGTKNKEWKNEKCLCDVKHVTDFFMTWEDGNK
jgi:hypothetical protein